MAAVTTILAAIGLGVATAGTAYGIVASEDSKKKQSNALDQQKKVQQSQVAEARGQQRRSQQAMAAANRAEPDVAGIMGRASAEAGGGVGSTMLTGPTGVDPQQLQLGRSTLLGS